MTWKVGPLEKLERRIARIKQIANLNDVGSFTCMFYAFMSSRPCAGFVFRGTAVESDLGLAVQNKY